MFLYKWLPASEPHIHIDGYTHNLSFGSCLSLEAGDTWVTLERVRAEILGAEANGKSIENI